MVQVEGCSKQVAWDGENARSVDCGCEVCVNVHAVGESVDANWDFEASAVMW